VDHLRNESPLGDYFYESKIRSSALNVRVAHAEQLYSRFCASLTRVQSRQIESVRIFAEKIEYQHPGMASMEYFLHPVRVAALAGVLSNQNNLMAAKVGLLHNVYELTQVEKNLIISHFGEDIHHALETLNIDRSRQHDHEYLKKYYDSIAQLPGGLGIVKVIDKIDNLYTLSLTATETVRINYLQEVNRFLVPLCERVEPNLSSKLLSIIQHYK
jgi:(p)ppGpp synthase/HD superfamily hydrolase